MTGKLEGLRFESNPAIEQALTTILGQIGEDPQREGLRNTPARFAKALAELTAAAWAGVTEFYLCAPRSSSASHASCMIALALVSLSPFCLPRHRSRMVKKLKL